MPAKSPVYSQPWFGQWKLTGACDIENQTAFHRHGVAARESFHCRPQSDLRPGHVYSEMHRKDVLACRAISYRHCVRADGLCDEPRDDADPGDLHGGQCPAAIHRVVNRGSSAESRSAFHHRSRTGRPSRELVVHRGPIALYGVWLSEDRVRGRILGRAGQGKHLDASRPSCAAKARDYHGARSLSAHPVRSRCSSGWHKTCTRRSRGARSRKAAAASRDWEAAR